MRSSAARAIGRQVVIASVASARDFDAAFAQFIKAGAGALLGPRRVVDHGPTSADRRAGDPARNSCALFPARVRRRWRSDELRAEPDGCLSPRGGIYVGRILKGEKPGNLRVELPTKYDLAFNLQPPGPWGWKCRRHCSPTPTR
jgi:putative ABC transport system substrate-binding protein